MSFLDIIPAEIDTELAEHFRDATLKIAVLTPDGEGGFTASYIDRPVKALRLDYSLEYRTRNQIPGTDHQVIVLRYGVLTVEWGSVAWGQFPWGGTYAAPGTDHRITLADGVTYSIISIESDPADATWTFQCRTIGA